MSNLIPRIPCPTDKANKVLLLAHRQELLNQAYNQIKRYNPNLTVEIDQGKRVANYESADVIIASVPTLGRSKSNRIDNLDPSQFKAVLIDEAHHAVADSYQNIIHHFSESSNKVLIWGCSATVRRHDGLSLADVFEKMTYHMDFLDLVEQGYLCPMKVTTVQTSIDLSDVRHYGGDFVISQLSNAVNIRARNDVVISSWKNYAAGRQSTLVFAVDIQHTQDLCNAFRQQGIEANFITSKTPEMTRQQIIQDFRDRKLPVLINCAILTEGTDMPSVDCILMARPTRSATLFQQMFGRGLRLHKGKKDCLVIDFADNFERGGTAGIVTIPTLLGLSSKKELTNVDILDLEKQAEKEEQEIEEQEKEVRADDKITKRKDGQEENLPQADDGIDSDDSKIQIKVTEYGEIKELMADISPRKNVRTASRNAWVEIGDDKCVLLVLTRGSLILEREESSNLWHGFFKYSRRDTFAKRYSIPITSDTLTDAIRAADTWLRKKFPDSYIHNLIDRNARFRFAPCTEAQKDVLDGYNIKPKPKLTKGQAMDLITKVKYGQLKLWKEKHKKSKKEFEERQKFALLRRKPVAKI
ncbi:P-loop containing nucleoside triphosphate hydrolase protein [Rhizopus microsporus ATCC 52813]|uniref:P-loop containing nucleoside triphosphate hydrolase protein n=1 Tax=Rhizopus microsporus ATCC 52813 TaxID=1340429 RepID=A0A2G4T5K3_RHIZD|nr:P-loop containing nucleoside triphosphate hydrolase protein [Rhizopus microsporus ATCC 52813]PHZ16287.1 P-loop containing nucleoside triphosphate hydrolase protein [Rhizopus microsporus ATCC 52813]